MLNTLQEPTLAPNNTAQTLSPEHIDALIAERLAQLKGAQDPTGNASTQASTEPNAAFQPIKHALAFSGSGSEYFRIWIVNLLLTIVTLTLYSPWAKVRKMQYFYRNTTLDAQPFDYHAKPWALFKGRLVALGLLGAYTLSGYLGTAATLAFGALVIAIGPWLMWRSLHFKLANSSYRGVRFNFTGSLKGAYWVFGIATVVVVGYLVGITLITQSIAEGATKGKGITNSLSYMGLFALVPFLFPWWHQAMKNYQHQNYAWASTGTHFFATVGDFYSQWFKNIGVTILIGLAFGALIGLLSAIGLTGLFNLPRGGGFSASAIVGMVFAVIFGLILYGAFIALVQAYQNSRFQNMVWNKTNVESKNDTGVALEFDSKLRMQPLAKVIFLNLVLTIVTLGLYWPFAAVKLAKIRLESVSITQNLPWASIAPSLTAHNADGALGNEVQDAFDVDFAL